MEIEAQEGSIELKRVPTIVPSYEVTPEQKVAIDDIYTDVKQIISTLSHTFDESIITTLTKIIGEVIKLVQAAKSTHGTLSGSNKKVIALEVIRLVIIDVVPEEKRQKILDVLHEIGDSTINVMIYVSHGLQDIKKMQEDAIKKVEEVQVVVKEAEQEVTSLLDCCVALFKK
jgi:hypothetical protein